MVFIEWLEGDTWVGTQQEYPKKYMIGTIAPGEEVQVYIGKKK